MAFSRN